MKGRGNCRISGGPDPVPDWIASAMNRGDRYFVEELSVGRVRS
ncbi:hypothetical protein [Desulfobacter hydrogenophilus]|nr:hypothetical protein [Desulfobacter hydrogenophilus]